MNHAEHLMALCGIMAGVMPSETAAEHASLEWQMAREIWLEAGKSVGASEEAMRRAGAVAVAAGIKALVQS